MPTVAQIKAQLFAAQHFVCGGHGVRWANEPGPARFTVPVGMTIHFYCDDDRSVGNQLGQSVDRIVLGGAPPPAVETITSGQQCYNYRLLSHDAGAYVNLGMSSMANGRFITTDDLHTGLRLEDIVKREAQDAPYAEFHWSACRNIRTRNPNVGFNAAPPVYYGRNAALATGPAPAGPPPLPPRP